jgi:hypothetical protein
MKVLDCGLIAFLLLVSSSSVFADGVITPDMVNGFFESQNKFIHEKNLQASLDLLADDFSITAPNGSIRDKAGFRLGLINGFILSERLEQASLVTSLAISTYGKTAEAVVESNARTYIMKDAGLVVFHDVDRAVVDFRLVDGRLLETKCVATKISSRAERD